MHSPTPASKDSSASRILVTGASGYVGGRLIEALEQQGLPLRCMARRPDFLSDRVGATTSVVQGDCLEPSSLGAVLEGIETAFYLVHSMGTGKDFEKQDRTAASNFGQAAKLAGVKRIVYLGGLGDTSDDLSPHLRSRHETGEVLRESGVPVVEFRASIVLGSGSLSFELIRNLIERLPVMICPRWVQIKAQPIHIQDVIAYLVASIELPDGPSQIFEIGGQDQVSYGEIMKEYARQRGLRRTMISVPLLTPYLSSLWLSLTTPVYAQIGRKLISSIKYPTIVRDDSALRAFSIRPVGLSEAIRRAVHNEDRRFAATSWFDAVSSGPEPLSFGGQKFGARLVDSRSCHIDAPPSAAFAPVRRIGGKVGWYYGNVLWRIRGFIDLLLGGVGLRRGRRDPERLRVGDALDFWRVVAYKPDQLLRLSAEMKVPGRAWLEFEVKPDGSGGSTIRQTAMFDPVGLLGRLYWYGIYPLHGRVFGGMLRGIARAVPASEKPLPSDR